MNALGVKKSKDTFVNEAKQCGHYSSKKKRDVEKLFSAYKLTLRFCMANNLSTDDSKSKS